MTHAVRRCRARRFQNVRGSIFIFDDQRQALKLVSQSRPATRNAQKHRGSASRNLPILSQHFVFRSIAPALLDGRHGGLLLGGLVPHPATSTSSVGVQLGGAVLLFAFDHHCSRDILRSQLAQFVLRSVLAYGAGVRIALGGLVAEPMGVC